MIVSVVNKLIPVSEGEDTSTEQEETINKLMDNTLLFSNANQELNFRRRELLRPQLNPIIAELFGDDLPKSVKDITDTNRLTSKLTKDNYSRRSGYRPGERDQGRNTHWKHPFSANNYISIQVKKLPTPPFTQEVRGKKKAD